MQHARAFEKIEQQRERLRAQHDLGAARIVQRTARRVQGEFVKPDNCAIIGTHG
jgi:hypothetical protein